MPAQHLESAGAIGEGIDDHYLAEIGLFGWYHPRDPRKEKKQANAKRCKQWPGPVDCRKGGL